MHHTSSGKTKHECMDLVEMLQDCSHMWNKNGGEHDKVPRNCDEVVPKLL